MDTHELDRRIAWKQACVGVLEEAGFKYVYGHTKEIPKRESNHGMCGISYVHDDGRKANLKLPATRPEFWLVSRPSQEKIHEGFTVEALAAILTKPVRHRRMHSMEREI